MIVPGFERRLVAATAVLIGGLCRAPEAAAHAPPAATDVQWFGDRAIVRTNRGLILQDAGETPFRIVCNDAFRTSLAEVPPLTTTSDGRILVGTFKEGLLLSSPDRCNYAPVAGALAGINAVAVATNADVTRALVLPPDGSPGALFESRDDAHSFAQVATFTDPPNALRLAPSDANRLYVSTLGANANETFPRLLRSADAGHTFEELAVELDVSELRAYVLAVDPLDSEVLFVRTQSRDGLTPERLLRSDDGGQSFHAVLEATGPLSIAVAADGVVWAGGAEQLYRSSDGGRTFSELTGLDLSRVTCLVTRGESLYVCGFHAGEFGVVVSPDRGSSLRWFLRFQEVQARLDCAAESDERRLCQAAFDDWSQEQPPLSAAGGSSGAEVTRRGETAAGCGVASTGQRPGPLPLWFLLPSAVALARVRRGRRRAAVAGGTVAIAAALVLVACGSEDSDGAASTANPGAGSSAAGSPSAGSSAVDGAPAAGAGTAGASTAGAGTAGARAADDCAAASDPGGSFEENCLACAATSCERCLCTDCSEPVQACASTSGCPQIAACIRASGCVGIACYCGTFDAVACGAGQANGPCKATILAAPGSSVPSLLNPSAGPASDAAVAIAACTQPGQSCAQACPTGG